MNKPIAAFVFFLAALLATSPAQTFGRPCSERDGNFLPAEVKKDVLIIPVRVNGSRPLHFIVDSEAGSPWVISRNTMKRLHLKASGDLVGIGAGPQAVSTPYIKNVNLRVGTQTFLNQEVDVLDLQEVSRFLGEEIDGIVGSEIFRRYKVRLDYRSRSVTLIGNRHCQPAGTRIQLQTGSLHFVIHASFSSGGQTVDGPFMVDSGAGPVTIVLNKNGSYICHEECLLLPAMGGSVMVRPLPSGKVSLDGMEIKVANAYRFVDTSAALDEAKATGLIGGGVLRAFIVTFDWREHAVFFQAN